MRGNAHQTRYHVTHEENLRQISVTKMLQRFRLKLVISTVVQLSSRHSWSENSREKCPAENVGSGS